jgi:ABC-2 type transporter.
VPKEDLLKAGFFPEDSRPLLKDEIGEESSIAIEEPADDSTTTSSRSTSDLVQVSFKTQVIMLLQRERRNILRNKKALAARFVFTTVMSFLLGVIFWKIGDRSLASFPVSTHHHYYSRILS